jgi:tetratricopeptide (TPR) repeat protein
MTGISASSPLSHAAGLIAAGRFDAALKALAGVAEGTAGLDALRGEARLGRKEAAAALAHLERARAGAPGDGRLGLLLARAHMLGNDPGRAVELLEGLPASTARDEVLAAALRRDARLEDCARLVETAHAPTGQMRYERAMSLNGLGRAAEALAAWDELTAARPDWAAAWYGGHGPALELRGADEALRRLERAAACPKANGRYRAMAAAHDALAGRPVRPFDPRHAHVVESAAALTPRLAPGWRLFGLSAPLLAWALGEAERPGLVLEFGVRRGTSLAVLAAHAGQEVHGFDSFEGLPEAWGSTHAGVLTTGGALPEAGSAARLHPGWFEDTLPPFLATHAGPVRFANIDSDIYSSARTVLGALRDRIGPGTVLVFDELIGNRTWRDDEYRALAEFTAETGAAWEVIAVNPATKQVAIRMG